jgi:hypothetical protein
VLCGEHGNEEQANGAPAHAKCLRVRQRKTGETRMVAAQSKRMVSFLFYRLTTADTLEFGHILASSCKPT